MQQQILEQLPAERAQLLLRRHPERPACRASKPLVRAQPGVQDMHQVPSLRARIVAVNGVPADQVQATPGHRLGAARRPRPDLCRHAARGHAPGRRRSGGRRTITARRWCRSTPTWRKGWDVGIGDIIRVNVLGRDIDLTDRQPARHRLAVAVAELLHGRQPRPAGSMRRTPTSPRSGSPTPDQGALLRAVTDALPNVTGIRVAGRAGRHRRAAGPGRRGADRDRLADPACRGAGAGRRGRRRPAPPDAGGGDPEDARRHPPADPRGLADRVRRAGPGRRADRRRWSGTRRASA